jgi:hypothetical protein
LNASKGRTGLDHALRAACTTSIAIIPASGPREIAVTIDRFEGHMSPPQKCLEMLPLTRTGIVTSGNFPYGWHQRTTSLRDVEFRERVLPVSEPEKEARWTQICPTTAWSYCRRLDAFTDPDALYDACGLSLPRPARRVVHQTQATGVNSPLMRSNSAMLQRSSVSLARAIASSSAKSPSPICRTRPSASAISPMKRKERKAGVDLVEFVETRTQQLQSRRDIAALDDE